MVGGDYKGFVEYESFSFDMAYFQADSNVVAVDLSDKATLKDDGADIGTRG